jgi:redox-sensitive bicupin YhaK (pirin superfamily)
MASLEATLVPPTRDLGDGFKVRRALPSAQRRMIGPFVFLDEMGPAHLAPGAGLDVRPHPHIGLATLTYLFEGEILHQDSLGVRQPIRPGDVKWMVAGRGIVHSERTPQALRPAGPRAWGLQSWLALPGSEEERAPSFHHLGRGELPVVNDDNLEIRVVAGVFLGMRSPLEVLSDLFYADVTLRDRAVLSMPAEHVERGAYIVDGSVEVDGQRIERGRLLVLKPDVSVSFKGPARLIVFGGEPLGPRYLWWNFVSSSKERIEQAKQDWKAGRFGGVPGDAEFIPLPPDRRPRVDYP